MLRLASMYGLEHCWESMTPAEMDAVIRGREDQWARWEVLLGRVTSLLVNIHVSRGNGVRPSDVFPPREDDEGWNGDALSTRGADVEGDEEDGEGSVLQRIRTRKQAAEARAYWDGVDGEAVRRLTEE